MGRKLGDIVTGIGKVSSIVSEIVASAGEQVSGIDQVNRAVAEMDKVTQQNAASAEQSSSAATQLSGQSQELATMVDSFTLGEAHSAPRTAGGHPTPTATVAERFAGDEALVDF